MKKPYKIYLSPDDYYKLHQKASELFKGRGVVSRYIEKISHEPIVFLDSNLKTMLEVLKLSPNNKDH